MSGDLPSDELLIRLLTAARWYVSNFEPRSADEDFEMNALLQEIDNVLPSPEPMAELCGEEFCCRPKGHEGAHDEIPF